MIRIAICDDEPSEIERLTQLFDQYRKTTTLPLQIVSFSSGFSLLDAIDCGTHFDIAVLDILMPGENGIEIAREIRSSQSDMEILFLTSSPEYAVDSYEVKAQNYLLKPVSEKKFFSAFDDLFAQLSRKENAGFIVYSSTKQYTRILFSHLIYGEAMHKSVNLYLSDQTCISCIMTFTEFLKLLETHAEFIRPHRSYVVNMNFIQCVTKTELCLTDGKKIPLPRNKYASVSKQFLNFAFSDSFES